MANQTDLRVRISADLADIKQGLGLLRGELAKVKAQANTSLGGGTSKFTDGIKTANRELRAFAATYLSLQGVRLLAGITDEATRLRSRIREAKGDYQAILAIAQSTRTGLSATADLYTRIERSTRGQIKSQGDLLGLTKSVNQAIKLSYTGTAQGEAAVLQLGQALSSGKLAGDEFRSISENAPRLLQSIADGIGVPIGALKKLSSEGKLTTDVIIKALLSQSKVLETEYARVPVTIGDALTQIRNRFVDYIGNANEATGASKTVAEAIGFLARNLSTILDVLIRFAAIYAAHLLLFRAAPALYGAAATALAVYKEQVIATALAQELGIKTAVTWSTRLRGAAGLVLAAFTGWQIGSYLRDQFEDVELAGIALASGLHVIAVQIQGYFQDAGLRIKLALAESLNAVIGISGRINSAVIGVMSNLPGPIGAAYTKLGQASQRLINGLKIDTRAMASEVSAANQRIANSVASVRAVYQANADSASAKRRNAGAEANNASGSDGADGALGAAADKAKKAAKAVAESFKLELDTVQRQLKALDQLYEDGLIGVAAYFDKKRDLLQRDIDLQVAQAQAELVITTDLGRRRDIEEQIAILLRNRAEIGPQVARDQAKAEKELTDQLALLEAKLKDLQGGFGNEATERLKQERDALLKKFNGDPAAAQTIKLTFDAEAAKVQVDGFQSRLQAVVGNLRSETDYINSQSQLGVIGPSDAEDQLNAKRDIAIGKLRDLKVAAEAYLATQSPGSPGYQAAIEGVANISSALAEAEAAQHQFANSVKQGAEDALTGFFTDLATSAKNFKDAFKSMVLNFVQGLARMAAEALAKRIILSFIGGGAGAGAAPSAKGNVFGSGGLQAFARGAAFALPGLMAFANGGAFTNSIVTSPQLFTFGAGGQFGVMGEAGPEAVMPLTRGPNGKLGVEASGGGAGLVTTPIVVIGDDAIANALAGAAGERVVMTHVRNNWDGLHRG